MQINVVDPRAMRGPINHASFSFHGPAGHGDAREITGRNLAEVITYADVQCPHLRAEMCPFRMKVLGGWGWLVPTVTAKGSCPLLPTSVKLDGHHGLP